MQTQKQTQRFYYIEDMAELLGKSVVSIHGHLARKQYDAVPPPMRLGRRLVWLVEAVDEWIGIKVDLARAELREQMKTIQDAPKKRGRPTKAEMIKKRKELDNSAILASLETKSEKQE
ncbi:MAG: transcriptional regulator [Candidatus Peribacteria bacterium]|jgi:predicted DNA-binding transcriptional regulator AlpA|nr:transcriptional regulator [Candidatus Peribacteria bacterium]